MPNNKNNNETKVEKILESYITRSKIKAFLGDFKNFRKSNAKGFLIRIFGHKNGLLLYQKYGILKYNQITERLKKQRLRVKQSAKIQELQAKYPSLNIIKAFTYARLNDKFEITHKDIQQFENIIKILQNQK
ncbi:hypothetical protein CNT09_09260 [Campylobacter coli]|uniref:hypothetical protein n=1 Tax=Helicobacter pullorum TaxID=35818 RepID=UPI0006BB2CA6|nr:hypothetical protein [Helicobacter pullorum]EAI7507902.1 hypothetical protein [Campylobacter coli]KAB0573891.1 hypothetical protein F7P74_09020 [Helicobacter pullorum NCTC 12824]EAK6386297.1 hypothetical protein [Campylobacter coli]ECQ5495508.1 hypothetical protein [Campylobacter coli]EDO9588086.1 hypothetical protein [Campylobacter coli]